MGVSYINLFNLMLFASLLLAFCCHITVCSLVSTVFICPAFDFTGLKCKFPDSLVSELIYKHSQCSRRSGVCFLLWACVLMLFCMCPYTYMCVSVCLYAYVLMLLCICPHALLHKSLCIHPYGGEWKREVFWWFNGYVLML